MHRRRFCKLITASVTAAAAQAMARTSNLANLSMPRDFDTLTENYEAFCATPEDKRSFYALKGGKIVQQALGQNNWRPTAWGAAPSLPVSGGSWDGVPMDSPIPGLNGEGPYKPNWESLLQYEAPD